MQAAAMSPIALNEEGVDAAVIEKKSKSQKIFCVKKVNQVMLDNIAKGKLARFFKDNTLVNQDYIKDNKLSVANYVKSLDKDLIVTGFKRAALG
jgi:elongation factor Ts